MNNPLFKLATPSEFEEMKDYLLASGFETKETVRSTAQYQQFQSTSVPTITTSGMKSVPFIIAVHPETAKWYIPGTTRYGMGLPSLQRVIKKFNDVSAPVKSVAPSDDSTAQGEMDRLVDMSKVENTALEPRGKGQHRETHRDLRNTHNRSLRFLNSTLQKFGFGDYEVWKGERHFGSDKETYVRFNPLRSSFGYTTKSYERTPKYHSYTRYAGDYGMVEPAALAAMIACHRGYNKKFPGLFNQIMAEIDNNNRMPPDWYEWNAAPSGQ